MSNRQETRTDKLQQGVFLALFFVLPTVGAAQATDTARVVGQKEWDDTRPAVELPCSDRWYLELTGGFFLEAWDLNEFREELTGGAISINRRISSNWTVGFESTLLYVNQDPAGDVFLPAFSILLRRKLFRAGETWVSIDGGGGVSYASNEVPYRGTRFNLVSPLGVGLSRALSDRIDFVGGLRWLHVSNNSLDVRLRNPDIQAPGLYVGWRMQ